MSTRTASKKILQSFHARDGLWEAFSSQAEKLDCSIDYLINEAMRTYAQAHDFISNVKPRAKDTELNLSDLEDVSDLIEGIEGAHSPNIGSLPRPPHTSNSGSGNFDERKSTPYIPRPPHKATSSSVSGTAPTIAERSNSVSRPVSVPAPPRVQPPSMRPPMSAATPGSLGSSPMVPPRAPSQASNTGSGTLADPSRPVLTIIFQGHKIKIQKDQFIIGRGSKSADMPIKDPNVSRKHAAIIFHNGAYYIKDLGSTNGVQFGDHLVDSKRIDEGDIFSICGHQFHFTYY